MRRAAVITAIVAAAGALPAAAFAHATLLRSDPAAQSTLASLPAEVVLRFSQQVTPVENGVDVTGPNGGSVVAGTPHLAVDDVRVVVIPLQPGLPRGDYTVRWRVASADGHLVGGAFAVSAGTGRPPPLPAARGSSTVDSGLLVARFLYFLGLFVLVGGAFVRWAVFAPAVRPLASEQRAVVDESERAGFGVLAFAGVALVLVGGWAAVLRQSTQVAGISFWAPLEGHGSISGEIAGTRFGREFGHGIDAAAALFVLVLLGYGVRRSRRLLYAAAAAGVVAGGWALLGPSLSGHAGDPGRGALTIAVDAAHVLGAAVWIGGLAHVFAVAAPATAALADDERRRVRLALVQRFSRLALASVALVAVSGIGRALWELGAVSQIWSTAYGRTLVIKTVVFGGLLALGYRNRKTLADFAAVRRRVGLELALLVTLTAAVSLLTALPPAKDRPPATPPSVAAHR